MSDPFRSDLAVAQEKLRRAEEEIAELRDAKDRLERAKPYPAGALVAGGLVIAFASAALTFWAFGRYRYAIAPPPPPPDVTAIDLTTKLDACEKRVAQDKDAFQGTSQALDSCLNRWMQAPSTLSSPAVQTAPNLPPPDPAAIKKVLASVNMASCWRQDYGQVHVMVTFQQDGTVVSAAVDTPKLSTVDEQQCVKAAFKDGHIPPYDGGQIRVGRSYAVKQAPDFAELEGKKP